jgi:hypothetical protein
MSNTDDKGKTLEMRIAAIEDKLAQLHISEDEMAAYHKVSAAMGRSGGGAAAQQQQALSPQICSIAPCTIHPIRPIGPIRPIFCYECFCGPCNQGGTGGGGGGFGGF